MLMFQKFGPCIKLRPSVPWRSGFPFASTGIVPAGVRPSPTTPVKAAGFSAQPPSTPGCFFKYRGTLGTKSGLFRKRRTQTNYRGGCPSTLSADLVDPASGSPLRRTRPSGHQTIETKAHCKNDPATPRPRLSDRTTECSTQPSTNAVIFEPGITPFHFNDRVDEFLGRSFRARLSPTLGRKQHLILSFLPTGGGDAAEWKASER